MKRTIVLMLCAGVLLTACKKDKKSVPPAPEPGKAVLAFPAKNEACTQATILSDQTSEINFKWQVSDNTDSYKLTVKDLDSDGAVVTAKETNNTELKVNLARGKAYSWSVQSLSSKSTATSQSETWKFFNPAPVTLFYSPFPAELLTPAYGTTVTATGGKTTLEWTGSDPDKDITGYTVYLGETSTPPLYREGLTTGKLAEVEVKTGITYYWKIVTKDARNNVSHSPIYRFNVN